MPRNDAGLGAAAAEAASASPASAIPSFLMFNPPLRFATRCTPSFQGGCKAAKLAVDSHRSTGPDEAVEAVRPSGRPGEEVEVVGRAGGRAVAERDRPEPVDRDRRSVGDPQLPLVHPLAVAALLVGA